MASRPSWYARGLIFENCSCTLVCPGHMHFSQNCTYERCKGYWALRIDEGKLGDVSLAGTRAVIAFDTPQRMVDGGWLLAWLAYAIAAELLQRALQITGLMPPGGVVIPSAGAIIFLVAGLYQFAPLKRACLTHCRTPVGYFLTRWIDGPSGGFRMGLHHGLFCVGCCWALMATTFAVGVMNAWWMLALGIVALVEQIAPHGQLVRRVLGGGFLLTGIFRLVLFA